jgi:ribosomal protein S21
MSKRNVARVRVEVNPKDDPEVAFKRMFIAFKIACTDAGIMHTYKQHETFESKTRKKRRKQRDAEIARMKNKLRENFLQQQLQQGKK